MKIVSQLDPAGYFVAPVEADESPLEPGVFLIPGGAVEVAPPEMPPGLRARLVGTDWVFEDPLREDPPQPPPLELPPPPAVPPAVSRFQACAALLGAGLLDSVEAVMANPETDRLAKLAWSTAQEFRRDSPLVTGLGQALGLDEAALDDLFAHAGSIVA